MRHTTTLALAATALIALACSSGGKDTAQADDKYTQTWTKRYADTTCVDWTGQMTEKQHFAAAADMLTSARNKGDGGQGLPDDSLIGTFRDGITNVCSTEAASSQSLAEIGAGLYLTERDQFKPSAG